MSQTVGHLDFFPNGGVEMPGCQKNILSQIVDIDGIWEGKTMASTGYRCEVYFSLLNLLATLELYRVHIFLYQRTPTMSPKHKFCRDE